MPWREDGTWAPGRKKGRNPVTGAMVAKAKPKAKCSEKFREARRKAALIRWEKIRADPELAAKQRADTAKAGKIAAVTRLGMPPGWRATDWHPYWRKQMRDARKIVEKMEETGLVSFADEAPEDAVAAKEAMGALVAIIRTPSMNARDRIAASGKVLEFTKTKPAAKSEVTVKSAEDLLGEVADQLGI